MVTPIVMDINIKKQQVERITLMCMVTQLLSELCDKREQHILDLIVREAAIVANFMLILDDYFDIDTLSFTLNIIGHLVSHSSV